MSELSHRMTQWRGSVSMMNGPRSWGCPFRQTRSAGALKDRFSGWSSGIARHIVNYFLTHSVRQDKVNHMVYRIEEQLAEQTREAITEAVNSAVRDVSLSGQETPMLVVAATQIGAEHAQELLQQSIAAARHAGCSWTTIGEQLGVTKQAAQQRYGFTEIPVAGRSQRLLKPVTAFDEMSKLADAGAHGWHSISYGWRYHLLEKSDQQWEHRREAFPLPGTRRRLEAQGWVQIGTTYPWQYLKRPLGKLPLQETSQALW